MSPLGKGRMTRPQPCSNHHTPCPKGYVDWHEWAEKKDKWHVQTRCPECGMWAIWKRRKADRA